MDRERRDDVSYTGRRLFAVAAALAISLALWWRGAAWMSAHIIGDGASAWIFFLGVPVFVAYVVHRILEEVRGE